MTRLSGFWEWDRASIPSLGLQAKGYWLSWIFGTCLPVEIYWCGGSPPLGPCRAFWAEFEESSRSARFWATCGLASFDFSCAWSSAFVPSTSRLPAIFAARLPLAIDIPEVRELTLHSRTSQVSIQVSVYFWWCGCFISCMHTQKCKTWYACSKRCWETCFCFDICTYVASLSQRSE